MKKIISQAATLLVAAGASCWAQVQDPLHGYCGGTSQCSDNGTNSPTTNNPPTNFGFTVNGGGSGNLLLDILIPNNDDPSPSTESFALTGTYPGTATLFSKTAWTSGNLDAYLGISASPNSPIGGYLGPCTASKPCTIEVDPGATGYFVYQLSIPNATLEDVPNPNMFPLENFAAGDPALPIGATIAGFLNKGNATAPNWIAPAPSGQIFIDARATPPVPEPTSIVFLGSVVFGLATLLKRKVHSRV